MSGPGALGKAGGGIRRAFRWDIDKTYLATDFESLRRMLRVPFESASDKVAIAGASVLIGELRRVAHARGESPTVSFITASPRQIAGPILAKLALDGVEHDGVVFKEQMHHLVRGRFAVLREQVGFKLAQLLAGAVAAGPDTHELLFGDDWESDPFVYSLYADILAGRLDQADTLELLAMCGVHRHYGDRILASLRRLPPVGARSRVGSVLILRQRMVPASRLAVFGPRLVWFDDYLECSLDLFLLGLLDREAVLAVARATGRPAGTVSAIFDAVCSRGQGLREWLSPVRAALLAEGLMDEVAAGSGLKRLRATLARRRGSFGGRAAGSGAPGSEAGPLPDYQALVADWSKRRRKEREKDRHGR